MEKSKFFNFRSKNKATYTRKRKTEEKQKKQLLFYITIYEKLRGLNFKNANKLVVGSHCIIQQIQIYSFYDFRAFMSLCLKQMRRTLKFSVGVRSERAKEDTKKV